METDPWPGFKDDKAEWERCGCETTDGSEGDHEIEREDTKESTYEDVGSDWDLDSFDSVDSVDSVDTFDSFETVDSFESRDGGCGAGEGAGNGNEHARTSDAGNNPPEDRSLACKVGGRVLGADKLTPLEDKKTNEFLERYPELKEARCRGEEWTGEQMVQWATANLTVGNERKERIEALYLQAERASTPNDYEPPPSLA